jgi:hypothetical protein
VIIFIHTFYGHVNNKITQNGRFFYKLDNQAKNDYDNQNYGGFMAKQNKIKTAEHVDAVSANQEPTDAFYSAADATGIPYQACDGGSTFLVNGVPALFVSKNTPPDKVQESLNRNGIYKG